MSTDQHNDPSNADSLLGPEGASFNVPFTHRVIFTEAVLEPDNHTLRDVLAIDQHGPARCAAVIDAGVADAWPNLVDDLIRYVAAHADTIDLRAAPVVLPGGEAAKDGSIVADVVVSLINRAGLCRQSMIIVIGGGAILDAVGYATSLAHRGIRLVRLPTTTLAQDDAGIGVKNGINVFGKKNFLGTFAIPTAVINDTSLLTTLDDRDWRSGFAEAVKVACLKDGAFFERIDAVRDRLRARDMDASVPILKTCAALHLDHIVNGGDPFELRTARPLDFGHWSAHKLEALTSFELRHGEAVAIGIGLDTVISAIDGRLDWSDARRITDCLRGLGFCLYHESLENTAALLDGLEEFREHLGGRLTITLLEGIGRPIDVHDVDASGVAQAVRHLADLEAGSAAKCAG